MAAVFLEFVPVWPVSVSQETPRAASWAFQPGGVGTRTRDPPDGAPSPSLCPPRPQEWVTSTELLISLDRLNTFGDDIFKDPKVLQSYYYAISDFSVGGR